MQKSNSIPTGVIILLIVIAVTVGMIAITRQGADSTLGDLPLPDLTITATADNLAHPTSTVSEALSELPLPTFTPHVPPPLPPSDPLSDGTDEIAEAIPVTSTAIVPMTHFPTATALPVIQAEPAEGLFVQNLSFSPPTPLIGTTEFGIWPQSVSWSPDGQVLAVALYTGDVIQEADGTFPITDIALFTPEGELIEKVAAGFDPVWSPDGTRLAYLAYINSLDLLHLRIVDINTKETTEVATFEKRSVFPLLAWVSDKELAYYQDKPVLYDYTIKQARPLLSDSLLSSLAVGEEAPLKYITASPEHGLVAIGSGMELFLLKRTEGVFSVIKHIPHGPNGNAWAISPDGSLLAYTDSHTAQLKIISTTTDGTLIELPRPGRGSARHVSWAPDSKSLLYNEFEGLKAVNRDGSGLQLVLPTTEVYLATWSPNGQSITLVSQNNQLFSMNVVVTQPS